MREGIIASFDGPEALLRAVRRLRDAGYQRLEAYSPHPMPEVDEALAAPRATLARYTLVGGIFGALFGYGFQYYSRVVAYPLNVGGRPIHAWPMFIPITFEMTVLFAGLVTFAAWLVRSDLPRLYRPVFELERFRAAMVDGFFLVVDRADELFDGDATEALLREAGATAVEAFEGRR